MGMATIVAARAAGARTVIVTGTAQDRFRLDVAQRVGADHVIDVDAEDPVERVAEITGGDMADVVIDAASGNPVTVTLAMEMVRRGGHVVIAGMKDRRPVEGFLSDWIPMRQITIHPGAGLDVEKAVALLNAGEVPTGELLGETFTLDRVRGGVRGHDAPSARPRCGPRRTQLDGAGRAVAAAPCDRRERVKLMAWTPHRRPGTPGTARPTSPTSSSATARSTSSRSRAGCTTSRRSGRSRSSPGSAGGWRPSGV